MNTIIVCPNNFKFCEITGIIGGWKINYTIPKTHVDYQVKLIDYVQQKARNKLCK